MYLWENFSDFIRDNNYSIKGDNSSLDIKVDRNNEKKIIFEKEVANNNKDSFTKGKCLDEKDYKDIVLESTIDNNEIVLQKMFFKKSKYISDGKYIEQYQVSSIVMSPTCDCVNDKYLFDWIDNIDDDFWKSVPPFGRKNNIKCNEIIRKLFHEKNLVYCKGLCLDISGHNIYLLSLGKNKYCIIYLKSENEETRRKIRECLSFTLGRPLIYYGCSHYDENLNLIHFKSQSLEIFRQYQYNLTTLPPVNLNLNSKYIDEKIVSTIAGRIYDSYQYDFSHIFWLYWDAVYSQTINSSMIYAASIEALQATYSTNSRRDDSKSILSKADLKKLSKKFSTSLQEIEISEEDKKVLKNKFPNINQKPQGNVMKVFFTNNNLLYEKKEADAYKHRNTIVHGCKIKSTEYTQAIVRMKTLKVMFHRLVLSLTKASDTYIDYTSENFPTRKLHKS